MFKQNINTKGRILRLILGLFLLSLAFYYHSYILFGAALFCFFQALMGWCVFYQLLGKNSCDIEK